MRLVMLVGAGFVAVAGCDDPERLAQIQARRAQITAACQSGDTVACYMQDGDPYEVAQMEMACASRNLQACQAVTNYRVQQQQIQQQQQLAGQQAMAQVAQNSQSMYQPQYPVFQAPQVQPLQVGGGSNFYHCNQLGSYVISCR